MKQRNDVWEKCFFPDIILKNIFYLMKLVESGASL